MNRRGPTQVDLALGDVRHEPLEQVRDRRVVGIAQPGASRRGTSTTTPRSVASDVQLALEHEVDAGDGRGTAG